jgi:steroid 5-alpha reductase family enzyme
MTVLYLEALVVIAASLPVLMAGAWVVQQRTGNSGWVDAIRTFSPGLAGARSALWSVEAVPPNARHNPGPKGRVSAKWGRFSKKGRAQ